MSAWPELTVSSQILDLRERGSETVSHSEGTGSTAFATKSPAIPGSPFAAFQRSKNISRPTGRGMVSTINSGVMLSTIGSIIVDPDHDVEMHAMKGSSN